MVGVGYNWGKFVKYDPSDGHFLWKGDYGRKYLGPTKAEISLVWQIGRGNYNEKFNKKNKEAKR